MPARAFARGTALTAVVLVVVGCGAAKGDGGPSARPLHLRLVTTSMQGPCSAPPLTSQAPGRACDRTGGTIYDLGEALGVVTPTSVTRDDQASTVTAQLGTADAATLKELTGQAVGQQLAVLLDGRVLTAPLVKEPFATGTISLAFSTAAEAEKAWKDLSAPASS